jgi:hypothetical protein
MTTNAVETDRALAETLLKHIDAIELLLGHIGDIVYDLEGADVLRLGVVRAVSEIHMSLKNPILRNHPDLTSNIE